MILNDSHPANFFSVADSSYFPGLVAMYNSLRLAGHTERVTVLDRGLTRPQREALNGHVDLVQIEDESVNPIHMKPFAYSLEVSGVVVLIDSDVIVTGSLADLIRKAAAGKICVFSDPDRARWFPEWQSIFGLMRPPRRQTYFNTGLLGFSVTHFPRLLERWWLLLKRIRHCPTFMEGASMRGDPVSQGDQDAFNALVMTEVGPDSFHVLPDNGQVFRNHLPQVRVEDLPSLSCSFRNEKPLVLHYSCPVKPWNRAIWRSEPAAPFMSLLRRLTASPDVPLRVPSTLLPAWLRPGLGGRLSMWASICSSKTWTNGRRAKTWMRQRLPSSPL